MCSVGIAYPFTYQINRLLVLLRNSGAEVDAFWWMDEFTIYAHQARYEEGHLEADAPLARESLRQAVGSLVNKVGHEIDRQGGLPMDIPHPNATTL